MKVLLMILSIVLVGCGANTTSVTYYEAFKINDDAKEELPLKSQYSKKIQNSKNRYIRAQVCDFGILFLPVIFWNRSKDSDAFKIAIDDFKLHNPEVKSFGVIDGSVINQIIGFLFISTNYCKIAEGYVVNKEEFEELRINNL